MLLGFNIKNSVPGSTKKDRAIVDTAILNSMPLLDASPAKCPDVICFEFKPNPQILSIIYRRSKNTIKFTI